MFRRKAEASKLPVPGHPDDGGYESLDYHHPRAFLTNAGLVGVECEDCHAPVAGPWVISAVTHDILVPRRILCEDCRGR